MDLIPEIIFEEDIVFNDEKTYEDFLTYCEWFLFDGNIDAIDEELCMYFRDLCNTYVEPNYMSRIMIETYKY